MKLVLFVLFCCTLLIVGCESSNYITYQAKPSPNTYTFYSNGIPITSYSGNKEFILFSTEKTELLNSPYMRVWLLVQNNSDSAFVVKPYDIIELTAIIPTKFQISEHDTTIVQADSLNYWPQSPTEILQNIDAEKNASMILTTIGGALKAVSAKGTTIRDNNGNTYRINNQEEKRENILRRTNNDLNNIQNWYSLFENSINDGVLRVNTLFPNSAINGYVYFQLTDADGTTYLNPQILKKSFFELTLRMDNKIKTVRLSPFKVW